MPARPLSLSEVLRDEFRYFFDDPKPEPISIERSHIRELTDLVSRLKAANHPEKTRMSFLATAARQAGDGISEKSVLAAFQGCLGDPFLLSKLVDIPEVLPLIEKSLDSLLQIPNARRLLLEEERLAQTIIGDDELRDQFRTDCSAIRMLLAEGFRPAFDAYPPLLSTIGDDADLTRALLDPEQGAARRNLLFKLFDWEPAEKSFMNDVLRFGARFFSRLAPRGTVADRVESSRLARSATALKQMLGIDAPHPEAVAADPIEPVLLSHFNALLLEIAYSDYLADGHTLHDLHEAFRKKNVAALCLSGGGIRSATFNLGVLQGLADHRMLTRFHYISTVSGGGYIGSWLSSWTRRHHEGATGVAKDLSRQAVDPNEPEVKPIRHLREYSSYLAPKTSLFSVDIWTIAAMYLRNLFLNWTILLPALAAMLAAPRLVESFIRSGGAWPAQIGWATMIVLGVALIAVGFVRPSSDVTTSATAPDKKTLRNERRFSKAWLPPFLGGGILFSVYWPIAGPSLTANRLALYVATGSAISALAYSWRRAQCEAGHMPKGFFAALWTKIRRAVNLPIFFKTALREVSISAVGGYVTGFLLHAAFSKLCPGTPGNSLSFEIYCVFSLPLFLAVFIFESTLLVGLNKPGSDDDREWWARSAAIALVTALLTAIVSSIAIFGPLLILAFAAWVSSIGGTAGFVTWFLKKRQNQKPKSTEKTKSAKASMMTLNIAASITVVVILAAIALGTSGLLKLADDHLAESPVTFSRSVPWPDLNLEYNNTAIDFSDEHVYFLRAASPFFLIVCVSVLFLFSNLMSWLLNVNIYSMHGMYRNRLVRAYLGASRWSRHPDAFTGFDPQDNIEMWKLRPEALWPASIVDFDSLATRLTAAPGSPSYKAWMSRLDGIAPHLRTYLADRGSINREELMTKVVQTLNLLMRDFDLKCNVAATPSPALLRENRNYLDRLFEGEIKPWHTAVPPADIDTIAPQKALEKADEKEKELARSDAEHLKLLRPKDDKDDLKDEPIVNRPPLHVLNIALNLVGGDNLAWQERKADSFTVSSLHSGNHRLGYRDSAEYGDEITLGTAMAISGAAVSPNMGYNSSPAVTFLMTLFNARLGWWLGNPGAAGGDTYTDDSPNSALEFILDEAAGATDDSHDWVFLSDGGFFDNLGLYEMVLRRCKYIVVCDASSDGDYGFSDLGMAVRKIRIDFGIPIELTTKYIGPQENERFGKYCAVGKILYPDVDGYNGTKQDYEERCGRLLYVKPAVYTDCPPDVRNYRKENTTFPHETTADQFFSESQFESYRALGRHMIGTICRDKVGEPAWLATSVAAFFARALTYVEGPVAPTRNRAVTDMSSVVQWMQDSLG